MDNLIYLANILLGIAGFLIALKILREKKESRPMVCPLNMRCEEVTHSKYSKFLGLPLEEMGMFYYGLVTFSYAIFLFYPGLKNPLFVFSIFILTVAGFLFSAYLVSIQVFKLKEACSWCLMSAVVSTTLFVLTLQTNIMSNVINSVANMYEISIAIIYALTISIGFGTAIIAEILFYNFLNDERISEEEGTTLNTLRQINWLALGTMAVSNYLLYMVNPLLLYSTPLSMVKILILIFLIIINLIYDIFIQSILKIKYLKTLSYILGSISIVSWAVVIILELTIKP